MSSSEQFMHGGPLLDTSHRTFRVRQERQARAARRRFAALWVAEALLGPEEASSVDDMDGVIVELLVVVVVMMLVMEMLTARGVDSPRLRIAFASVGADTRQVESAWTSYY